MTASAHDQQQIEERLCLQIEGYHASALVSAAVKLGLPDRMESRHCTGEQLAEAMGLSAPHLNRFLRGLAVIGICEELPDKSFALTGVGHSLKSGSSSALREKATIVVEQYWRPWADLVFSLQTGKAAFDHVFGMSVWDWRAMHAEQGAMFDSYLARETLAHADLIFAEVDFSEVRRVADIGGGSGGLVAAVARAHAHIAGILFDQPQRVAAAKSFLQSLGVAERVQFVGGDFFAGIPVSADLYLLKSVLHDWEDAECCTILENCRAAMPGHSKLLVIERLLPARASEDPATVMIDLHMMTITGGRERSLEQFRALLSQSGLAPSNVTSTRSGFAIVEAVPV